MSYGEWLLLVGGIMEDTPLGQTVMIRKEDDPKRLKNYTAYENRIRNEWRSFRARQSVAELGKTPEQQVLGYEKLFAKMFG